MSNRTTISLIKADVGSLVGHHVVPTPLLQIAEQLLDKAKDEKVINSFHVFNVGDDLQLLMVHEHGEANQTIHQLAWNIFQAAANRAVKQKLYGAGQDLLTTAFSGNIRGMGPGVAEMEIQERQSDPLVVFAADKTSAGAFNFPLFRIFADPMNTAGLVIDPNMAGGFKFEVLNSVDNTQIVLKCPEEMYELIAMVGTVHQYLIPRVFRARDNLLCAVSSITKLAKIAGKYVGKDDPVMIIRAQHGLPAIGEILMPFMHSYLVEGWMRGSHWGPILPVSLKDAKCTVFDGPPRLVALGFQITHGAIASDDLGKPMIADLFADPAFDMARDEALQYVSMLRRMGEFEPARLSPEMMEYTNLPQIQAKLKNRFEPKLD